MSWSQCGHEVCWAVSSTPHRASLRKILSRRWADRRTAPRGSRTERFSQRSPILDSYLCRSSDLFSAVPPPFDFYGVGDELSDIEGGAVAASCRAWLARSSRPCSCASSASVSDWEAL